MNASRYPTWGSLARDYLPIMASSVSSERSFSSAGITITKRRNRLKSDIVEALQCMKAAMRGDLLMKDQGPVADDEVDSDEEDGESGQDEINLELIIDLESEEEREDNNDGDDFLPSD